MQPEYKILNLDELGIVSHNSFALDVLEGLDSIPKWLPSKYLYDERGSQLFEKIMALEEYYPTNCELEILKKCKRDLLQLASKGPFRLVELGVGDAKKTKVLLQHLLEKGLGFEYVPVDCCQEMVEQVVETLQEVFGRSSLRVTGLVGDYASSLNWLKKADSTRNIVLFLGSSIGNFDLKEVRHFLHQLWSAMEDGDSIFIGFDLKKDIRTLEKAYDDSKGVTREFNLNLLDRMNRELDADFDRSQFLHHSFYNPCEGRMESWLISKISQKVSIGALQKSFVFQPWEGIHVENSYKYTLEDIEKLAGETGFVNDEDLIDSKGYFAEAVWLVKKNPIPVMEAERWS